MAREFSSSRFVGYDFSEQAISAANEQAKELSNVSFEVKDVTRLPEVDRYDLITAFDAIHDQIKPLAVLEEIAKSLRPDGVFLMQDIRSSSELENNLNHPVGPFLYTISCLHCMTVSLANNGEGLGAMWGEEKARAYLKEAGFSGVVTKTLPHDFQSNFYIVSKG
jgi:SAM-dependent methyltransferase